MIKFAASAAFATLLLSTTPVLAQTADGRQHTSPPKKDAQLRVRVGVGGQVTPSHPGADGHRLRPYWDLAIARGSEPFSYESPDENFGFPVFSRNGFEAGPTLNLESARRRKNVGANVDEVGRSVEVGAFAQYRLAPWARARIDLRQGIGGHNSIIGSAGVDYISRDRDNWEFSIGPRVGFASRGYQRAYFGVNQREAIATGLPVYSPKGGIHALGAVAGAHYALDERWGVMGFAKYDRLIGDAGNSPLVRRYGKRDQLSGGVGLTYTFGRVVVPLPEILQPRSAD